MKRASLLLLLVVAACATQVAVQRWVAAPNAKAVRLEPVLERRDACLAAPYTLLRDQPVMSHGLLIEPRGDGIARELYIATARGPQFSPDSLIAFLDRNTPALRAIEGVESTGLSGCPTRDGPAPCIHLDLLLCAHPLDELASALSKIVADDKEVLNRQVLFHVALVGAAGPRCEADDARCKPEPYEGAEYDASARRGALTAAGPVPQCAWDGECKKSSGGNSCESWTSAHRPGKEPLRPELKDAFCGCVEGHCSWFVQ